jgi:hypothetical protein
MPREAFAFVIRAGEFSGLLTVRANTEPGADAFRAAKITEPLLNEPLARSLELLGNQGPRSRYGALVKCSRSNTLTSSLSYKSNFQNTVWPSSSKLPKSCSPRGSLSSVNSSKPTTSAIAESSNSGPSATMLLVTRTRPLPMPSWRSRFRLQFDPKQKLVAVLCGHPSQLDFVDSPILRTPVPLHLDRHQVAAEPLAALMDDDVRYHSPLRVALRVSGVSLAIVVRINVPPAPPMQPSGPSGQGALRPDSFVLTSNVRPMVGRKLRKPQQRRQ